MKSTSLLSIVALSWSVGCAGATNTTTSAQSPGSAEPAEEIVQLDTPEASLLPGSSEWEWSAPKREATDSTEAQVQPTSLRRNATASGENLKRLPQRLP